ncbi:MAG: hypothetical protein HN509_01625 [Halobacteriovoraceae bacterium]|jgi:hypothetical protein|nr:hypothetical protein [Halobacteriovoraceae bacterium]MBT5095788.1 hypothetical protein [Halobacteriovoraceae bacterium]
MKSLLRKFLPYLLVVFITASVSVFTTKYSSRSQVSLDELGQRTKIQRGFELEAKRLN